MIHRTKLLTGVFLALTLLVAGPASGPVASAFGVEAAHAQTAAQGPLVASVLFEGNQRFPDDQLLKMVGLGSRGVYSDAALQQDIESIRLAYVEAGFTNVSVTARSETLENGRVRVTFVVNEGGRAGVAAINFTGNNTFGAGTLKGVVRTKETGLLSWLLKDDTYSEQMLQVDRELIRQFYNNRGFPDAQVLSAVAEFDATRNAYFINFTISEGERYEFGRIDVQTSIAGLDTNALRGAIRTQTGAQYSAADLQRSTEDLALRATQQGFSFADVRPRTDRDVANRLLNVTYLVDEGARIYIERINITGNEKTRDFVIRRELEFAEGDPFNRSLVSRARSNVNDLGFFSAVDITSEPGSSPDQVVLNVAVTEQSTGDYGATVGYSTADGILGELSLTERNFLGRGQYLRVAVGASQSGQTYDFSFTEPRFMGLRVAAGIDLYRRVVNESGSNFYGSDAYGGQLRFGLPITDDLSVTTFVGYERRSFVDTVAPISVVQVNGAPIGGQTVDKGFIGYTLVYSTIDNEKRPTEGIYATFTQQYVGLSHNFVRSEARARYFMPLLQDSGIVASVRGQAGIINTLDNTSVSSIEAFFPGPTLVRGFTSRGIGPRVVGTGESVGSTMYAGISGEVEFPIPVLPETYGIRGAVFADAGWAGGTPDLPAGTPLEGLSDTLRASVGASLIWDSPFGPLRGDVAHVLSQDPADQTQVFALTLSTLL